MTRRSPAADTLSGVRWPVDVDHVRDTGEGGLWCYALVLAATYPARDPLVHCCGPAQTVALPLPDVVVHDPGQVYPPYTGHGPDPAPPRPGDPEDLRRYTWAIREQETDRLCHGAPVLAAVLLGSSGGSWWDNRASHYWRPGRDDLTPAGIAVVQALEALHQRPVHLTVYLDT